MSDLASPNSMPGRVILCPMATYRLQFNRLFTLRHARELVPYLRDLGISHIYASPLLKACQGSTHGYDVCDFEQLNPELGTEADLESLVDKLHRHKMGLVLDIVPNHMGVGTAENHWWWDVLEFGMQSRFARFFDIDWTPPDPRFVEKVDLPVLGRRYHEVLEQGELKLERCENVLRLRYADHQFPINSGSVAAVGTGVTTEKFNSDLELLDELIQKQHYRLTFWENGDSQLNYRRFFSITSLAALRMEDPEVFEATHKLIARWVNRGWVDGLRVDHPDGLRDPAEYLQRLRRLAPRTWIIVEKILQPNENLPAWPVAGTTGYDFLNRLGGLFIDPAGQLALDQLYSKFTCETLDFERASHDAKVEALTTMFEADVAFLTELFVQISDHRSQAQDFRRSELRDGIVELMASLSVYRTYVTRGENTVSKVDRGRVRDGASRAKRGRPQLSALIDVISDVLQLRVCGELEERFVHRFQQLSAATMAKGVEDTVFYSFNRFPVLNEVGGAPDHFGLSVDAFHAACREQNQQWPQSMLATSTHDTKRSEDVRARLCLLSEIPELWSDTVHELAALTEQYRYDNLPDHNTEYLFYQTIIGAWPPSEGARVVPAPNKSFIERIIAYMEKAVREAKHRTNWNHPNRAYEDQLKSFVRAALSNVEFVRKIESFVRKLDLPAAVTSLSQTLIKLTAPGVPDIYQGTELWDLSLVDPDNRRPVDYEIRRNCLDEIKSLTAEEVSHRHVTGTPKMWLIQHVLQFRREHPELFEAAAAYQGIHGVGTKAEHVVAFRRGERLIVIAPRLNYRLNQEWADTGIELGMGTWQNILTGEEIAESTVLLSALLRKFPVALLFKKEANL